MNANFKKEAPTSPTSKRKWNKGGVGRMSEIGDGDQNVQSFS